MSRRRTRVRVPSAPRLNVCVVTNLQHGSKAVVKDLDRLVEDEVIDPVRDALGRALKAWTETRDLRGLRRVLHGLLAKLDDV